MCENVDITLILYIAAAVVSAAAAVFALFGKGRRLFMDRRNTYDEARVFRFYAGLFAAVAVLFAVLAADRCFGVGVMRLYVPLAVLVGGFVYAEKSERFRK
jgi:hypothetical protein